MSTSLLCHALVVPRLRGARLPLPGNGIRRGRGDLHHRAKNRQVSLRRMWLRKHEVARERDAIVSGLAHRAKIESIATDMSSAYIDAVTTHLRNATPVLIAFTLPSSTTKNFPPRDVKCIAKQNSSHAA